MSSSFRLTEEAATVQTGRLQEMKRVRQLPTPSKAQLALASNCHTRIRACERFRALRTVDNTNRQIPDDLVAEVQVQNVLNASIHVALHESARPSKEMELRATP